MKNTWSDRDVVLPTDVKNTTDKTYNQREGLEEIRIKLYLKSDTWNGGHIFVQTNDKNNIDRICEEWGRLLENKIDK